jgi:LysM repeat protein
VRYDAHVSKLRNTFAWLVGIGVALTSPAPAQAFPHVVQKGETLASIAEKVYGRIQYERILVYANSLDACGGTSITPGMILEVPAVNHRRASAGESWQGLAKELLGDDKRAEVLAQANHGKPWQAPEDGAELIIPYNLRYVVQKEETVPSIASKFQADNQFAWTLDRYNHVGGHTVRRGDVMLVPLTDLPLTDAGKAEAAQAEAGVRSEGAGAAREAQRKALAELPQLFAEVRGGHYLDAVVRGTRLLTLGELTRPQQAEIHRALTEAFVALDTPGLAGASCQAWKAADPQASFDPNVVSPKILSACKTAEPVKP